MYFCDIQRIRRHTSTHLGSKLISTHSISRSHNKYRYIPFWWILIRPRQMRLLPSAISMNRIELSERASEWLSEWIRMRACNLAKRFVNKYVGWQAAYVAVSVAMVMFVCLWQGWRAVVSTGVPVQLAMNWMINGASFSLWIVLLRYAVADAAADAAADAEAATEFWLVSSSLLRAFFRSSFFGNACSLSLN